MPYGLYISAEGAQVQSRRMEVIANNIANVDTVGFKRDLAVMQSRYAEAIQRGTAIARRRDDQRRAAWIMVDGGVQFRETVTDFSPGPLKKTGNPTDAAIQGDGFFVVQKGQERLLTRAGNFRLTACGAWLRSRDTRFWARATRRSRLTPRGARGRSIPSGSVNQGDDAAGIADRQAGVAGRPGQKRRKPLSPVDRTCRPVAAGERAVSGGCLEMSAVQPTTEMTTMIETSRLLEANVNVMKTHNEMLQGLIERVLKA